MRKINRAVKIRIYPNKEQITQIGIGYDDLERCKNVVCVAYGEAKAAAVAGALRGGFINTLIIDSACGEKLL